MAINKMYHYHKQISSASTWVIQHNLNRKPIIDVMVTISGNNTKILPLDIQHTDDNTVTLLFSQAYIGTATLK